MHDPLEGVSPSGTIRTGVSRDRIPAAFESVIAAAVEAARAADASSSLYVYGSVATGMASPPSSDVDLLTVGLASAPAARIANDLSARFADRCRAVEIAVAQPADFSVEADQGYGGCVFLRHYCAHLAGPNLHSGLPEFAADARAARGFNGDIAQHSARWRTELEAAGDPAQLGRRLARKTLLAIAGLVSVHDDTWTTDRSAAAARWAEIEPDFAEDLEMLVGWSEDRSPRDPADLEAALSGVVTAIVASFEDTIGLWAPGSGGSISV